MASSEYPEEMRAMREPLCDRVLALEKEVRALRSEVEDAEGMLRAFMERASRELGF